MEVPLDKEPTQVPDGIHPQNLDEQNHWVLTQLFFLTCNIASTYGWYILIGGVILLYVREKLKPQLNTWKERREAADYHKNPDKFIAREQAIQEARLKMQEKYNQIAEQNLQKLKEQEEQKRQNVIRAANNGCAGGESGSSTNNISNEQVASNKSNKPSLRPAYNPLMGGGGSCGWRGGSGRTGRGG